MSGVVFDDIEDVDLWLNRIHKGLQNGIGRKEWNSEQKARHDGSANKNRPAQAVLDYASREGLITEEDRSGKLTTVQRFLGNDVFREFLGLDQSDPEEIARTRPKQEFDTILKVFLRDLVGKKAVNSRMNKPEIIAYTRPLTAMPGITAARVQSEPLTAEPVPQSRRARTSTPKRPERVKHVQHEAEIADALRSLGNEKLRSLYHSITTIDLDPHTPIVAVGTWSFFETLTSSAGRNDATSLDSYFSKAKLVQYGITGEVTSYRNAIVRIREYGNTTKHHKIERFSTVISLTTT